mgnify:CR=1 FL=1
MRLNFSLTTLLAALLLPLGSAFAEPIKFATVDYVPYALHDDIHGRWGFADVNEAIAERAGIAISEDVLPMARTIKNLERGLTDCVVFARTPWSEEKFQPVAKILDRFDAAIFTRAGMPISRVEDLHGKRLAIPRGSFLDSPISSEPNIERVVTNDYEQSVRLLKAGRVDAIAGSEISIFYYFSVEEMKREDIGSILKIIHASLWLHCAKEVLADDVVMQLRKATDALRSEGVFDRLVQRYIPADFS